MDTPTETCDVVTARGSLAKVIVRHGTSDLSLAGAFFGFWGNQDDEYRLAELHVSGLFLDVGAHIGLVTVAVLLDNPHARAICVEPLAENCALMLENAAVNGLAERVTVVQAAVAQGDTTEVAYDYADDPGSTYMHDNRYIGAISQKTSEARSFVTVPTVSLSQIVERYGPIDALKLDCEGCEWQFLDDPAIRDVRVIFGEWHGHAVPDRTSIQALQHLLGPTHNVEVLRDLGGTGDFRAVLR